MHRESASRILSCMALTLLLTACGGGGDSSDASNAGEESVRGVELIFDGPELLIYERSAAIVPVQLRYLDGAQYEGGQDIKVEVLSETGRAILTGHSFLSALEDPRFNDPCYFPDEYDRAGPFLITSEVTSEQVVPVRLTVETDVGPATTTINVRVKPFQPLTSVFFPDSGLSQCIAETAQACGISDTGIRKLSCDGVGSLEGIEVLPLQRLHLDYSELADLSPISADGALPKLEWLSLESARLADLSPLAAKTGLRFLQLFTPQVTDYSSVSRLTELRALNMTISASVDPNPVIAPLGSLEELWLAGVGPMFTSLSGLEGKPSLRSLHLITDAQPDVSFLPGMSSLEDLLLCAKGLTALPSLPGRLTKLELCDFGISSLAPLHNLTSLRYLLYTNHAGSRTLDFNFLSGLPLLQGLALNGTSVLLLPDLSHLRDSLHWLEINSGSVTVVPGLRNLVNLESLSLSDNQISDIRPVGNLSRLRTLNLSANPVGSISALAGLTGMESLGLSSTDVTDIEALRAMTALESLFLRCTGVSDLSPLFSLTRLSGVWVDGDDYPPNQLSMFEAIYGEEVLNAVGESDCAVL